MQSTMKIVIAVVVAALILVIGLIALTNTRGQAPETPVATEEPAATEEPVETEAPQEDEQASLTPDNADASNGDLYEGALAGLSEEEIGELAMAEEGVQVEGAGEDGVD